MPNSGVSSFQVTPILLIFDLDETLFHATASPPKQTPDFIVGPYAGYKRPLVDE